MLSCFLWSFMKDQVPYRGEGPVYMQGWWAFGFLSWLSFWWWCKDGAFPPLRGFVPNRPRKPTFFPPPLSLSLSLLPSTERKKEMEFFNYEPITVNKRICINPGAIESLHKTTTSFPVQKPQLNSKVKSWSLSLLLSTIWSSFVSQNSLQYSLTWYFWTFLAFPSLVWPGWCWYGV